MSSIRRHEGYFLLDHSQTQGLPDSIVTATGLPAGSGIGKFEAPTYTCSHCQAVVVINPDRKRERTYCRGCDHLICDNCAAIKAQTGKCVTFKQVIAEAAERAEKGGVIEW